MIAEAVNLESVDLAELGMVIDGILMEGRIHLVGEAAAAGGEVGVMVDGLEDFGGLAERADGEEIGGDEELQGSGVVRRTEARGYQAAGLHRGAEAVVAERVEGAVSDAAEAVGTVAVAALLLGESLEDAGDGLKPFVVEDARVAGHLPVFVGQADRVAERVDLPFALMHVGDHLGVVAHPFAAGRAVIEGVGVRVEDNALELASDHALDHHLELLVAVGQPHVGPHLGAGVAKPHGVDVAGVDKRVVLALGVLTVMYGSVESVGEAVLKHPHQFGVGQRLTHQRYLPLHLRRMKQTLCRRRAPGDGKIRGDSRKHGIVGRANRRR